MRVHCRIITNSKIRSTCLSLPKDDQRTWQVIEISGVPLASNPTWHDHVHRDPVYFSSTATDREHPYPRISSTCILSPSVYASSHPPVPDGWLGWLSRIHPPSCLNEIQCCIITDQHIMCAQWHMSGYWTMYKTHIFVAFERDWLQYDLRAVIMLKVLDRARAFRHFKKRKIKAPSGYKYSVNAGTLKIPLPIRGMVALRAWGATKQFHTHLTTWHQLQQSFIGADNLGLIFLTILRNFEHTSPDGNRARLDRPDCVVDEISKPSVPATAFWVSQL